MSELFKLKNITTMKKLFYFLIISFLLTSCDLFTKKKGCTDIYALNKDFSAEENDGSCRYSKVTFYASIGFLNGIPIQKIDVSINQNFVGSITSVYPNGPGNCSASGTVEYQFLNGNKVDWNTVIHLSNGGTVFSSGQVSPSSILDCIKVNVTR